MERAASNVATLIERLGAQGYVFEGGGASGPWFPPDAATEDFVEHLESTYGPLPLTARAWIEVVGDVDLNGKHPALPDGLVTDPLVVEFEYKGWNLGRDGGRELHSSEHEMWVDAVREFGPHPFVLTVAPDALHKANISGGAPYGVLVPDACADGTFRYDDGALLPFIEYLRLTFAGGGFSGWRRWPATRELWAVRSELAAGLLPI